jgi:hypothetical protein
MLTFAVALHEFIVTQTISSSGAGRIDSTVRLTDAGAGPRPGACAGRAARRAGP